MRVMLVALLTLTGCVRVQLAEEDRSRVDQFLKQVDRFNTNLEEIKKLLKPTRGNE